MKKKLKISHMEYVYTSGLILLLLLMVLVLRVAPVGAQGSQELLDNVLNRPCKAIGR